MDNNSQCISAHRMHKNFVFRKIWDREFNIKSVHFWTFKGISIFHKIPMMRRHKMRLLGKKFCCVLLPTRSWCSIKYFCIFKLCQSLPILSKFPQDQNKLSIWKFDSSHKILIIHILYKAQGWILARKENLSTQHFDGQQYRLILLLAPTFQVYIRSLAVHP